MDRTGNACDQRVSVLPTDDYVAVSPFTPLSQAIEVMKKDEGGCVIILDDGRVAGIFYRARSAGQDSRGDSRFGIADLSVDAARSADSFAGSNRRRCGSSN